MDNFELMWPGGKHTTRQRGELLCMVRGLDPFPVVRAMDMDAHFFCEGCGLLPMADRAGEDHGGYEICHQCWAELMEEV